MIFYFQETCTSLPTFKIEAESLDKAFQMYKSGILKSESEEVEENYLHLIFDQNGNEITFPEEWQ
jgi:hypothetical protein